MLDYLNKPSGISKHRIILPKWPYVENGLNANILKTKQRIVERLRRVDTDHLLVRLIHGSTVFWEKESRDFINSAKSMMYEVANSLGLSSNVSAGEVHHPGHFYGAGIEEIIVVHDDPFDTFTPWYDLKPIRVLCHPEADISFMPLSGDDRNGMGHAVLTLNYPMLLWMYRQWANDTDASMVNDSRLSVMHFIGMYVLPSMIDDHLDWVVFNRLYKSMFDMDIEKNPYKSEVHLIDYDDKMDDMLQQYQGRILGATLTYEELVSSVPTISHDLLWDCMKLPNLIVNHQTRWIILAARMPLLKWIIAYQYLTENKRNRTFDNDVSRTITRTRRGRWFPAKSSTLKDSLESDMDMIEQWLD